MLVLEVQATYFQPLSYNFNWFPSDEICSALTKTGKKKKTGKKGKGRKRMKTGKKGKGRKRMKRVPRLEKWEMVKRMMIGRKRVERKRVPERRQKEKEKKERRGTGDILSYEW